MDKCTVELADPLDAQRTTDDQANRARDAAEIAGERQLCKEPRDDRKQEETVDRHVVEEPCLTPFPTLHALEDRGLVEMERQIPEVRDRREPRGARKERERPASRPVDADGGDRNAAHRDQTIGRHVPRVRDPQCAEGQPQEGEARRPRARSADASHVATVKARASAATGNAIACAWRSP